MTAKGEDGAGAKSAADDIVVVGAGPIGLTAALALARSGFAVRLLDARPLDVAPPDDGRASAVAAAPRRMLRALGAWTALEAHAQPVHAMAITDGPQIDPLRPRRLAFEGPLESGEPFAHIVPNARLHAALLEAAREAGVRLEGGRAIAELERAGAEARLALDAGEARAARLVVAADGANSRLRAAAGIGAVDLPLRQWALSCTIAHERPHRGRAEQHFYPGGPLALLPLVGDRSSVVWSETRERVERLAAMDGLDFEDEIVRRIGNSYGAVRLDGPRHAFPLVFRLARAYAGERLALIGDAAHAIHPLAGQGLNLGFKDVGALAEIVVEADRRGEDIGSLAVLARYERWRRADSTLMGFATGAMSRLFGVQAFPLGPLRRLGLALSDRVDGLKRVFVDEAAGTRGTLPRLLKGEAP